MDLIENAGDQSALLARLEAPQAERAALQQRLHDHGAGSARKMLLPSAEELTTVYSGQVARLEELLDDADEFIEANRVLKELLGTVAVWPDEDARDGLRVAIRGSAVRLLCGDRDGSNANAAPEGGV